MKTIAIFPAIVLSVLLHLPLFANAGSATSTVDEPTVYQAFEELKKKPSAKIMHQDGWAIVSLIEKGNQVYWFLAPDRQNATPALIKKTINENGNKKHETKIISQCVAPLKVCDDLMKQFKELSKKYK